MGFSHCTNRVMGTDQVLILIFNKLKYVLKVHCMEVHGHPPDCHTKYTSLFPKCCGEAESTQLYRMSLNAAADLPKLFQHRSARRRLQRTLTSTSPNTFGVIGIPPMCRASSPNISALPHQCSRLNGGNSHSHSLSKIH